MKFTYPEANLSKVIKKFTYKDNYFHIEYFDGSVNDYYCADFEKVEEIKKIMLDQAKERQKKMDNPADRLGETISLYLDFIFTLGLYDSIKNRRDFMIFLCAMLVIINTYCQVISIKERVELKKFALFFEMYNSLDEINKSEFMKCIEFENIYQKTLDIDTIDDFSYDEIKTLYRKFKGEKN